MFDKESALPLSIALAIDTSLSTRHDLPLEQASAKRFAHAILRPIDAFRSTDSARWSRSHAGYTSDLKRIDEASTTSRGRGDRLYDAIYLASRALGQSQGTKGDRADHRRRRHHQRVDYKEAVRAAEEAEAIVYSIIIVPIESSAGRETGGEHALIQLSEDTGGKYYYATSTPQLDEAFRKISDELRTQYLLAYYPSQQPRFGVPPHRSQGQWGDRGGRLSRPPPGGILLGEVGVGEVDGPVPTINETNPDNNESKRCYVTICKQRGSASFLQFPRFRLQKMKFIRRREISGSYTNYKTLQQIIELVNVDVSWCVI